LGQLEQAQWEQELLVLEQSVQVMVQLALVQMAGGLVRWEQELLVLARLVLE
jgi:hypothetical protein